MSSLHEFSKRRKPNDGNEEETSSKAEDDQEKVNNQIESEKPKEEEKNKTDEESDNNKNETQVETEEKIETINDDVKIVENTETEKNNVKTDTQPEKEEPMECDKDEKVDDKDLTKEENKGTETSQSSPEVAACNSIEKSENINCNLEANSTNESNLMTDLLDTINNTITEIKAISDISNTESDAKLISTNVSIDISPAIITSVNESESSSETATEQINDVDASKPDETTETPLNHIEVNPTEIVAQNCVKAAEEVSNRPKTPTVQENDRSAQTELPLEIEITPSSSVQPTQSSSVQSETVSTSTVTSTPSTQTPSTCRRIEKVTIKGQSKRRSSIDYEPGSRERDNVTYDSNIITERANNIEDIPGMKVTPNVPNSQPPRKASFSTPGEPLAIPNDTRRQTETPRLNTENQENTAPPDVFRAPMITCRLITTTSIRPSTKVERRINRPACWSEKQFQYFKKENPWLRFRLGKLGCDTCIQIGKFNLKKRTGITISPEWTSFSITHYGASLLQQQRSLRKKVFEHRKSMAHKMCEHILDHYKLTQKLKRGRNIGSRTNSSNTENQSAINVRATPTPPATSDASSQSENTYTIVMPMPIKEENGYESTQTTSESYNRVKWEQSSDRDQQIQSAQSGTSQHINIENFPENFSNQQTDTNISDTNSRDSIEEIRSETPMDIDQSINLDQSTEISHVSEERSQSTPAIITDITDSDDIQNWNFCPAECPIYHSPTNTIEDQDLVKIFRTVYHIAKLNRPFADLSQDLDLQKINGCQFHKALEDSGEDICRHIATEMKFYVVKTIINLNTKFSIIIEEDKNLNSKPIFFIYLRSSISNKHIDIFLDVIELDNKDASEIFSSLIACLLQYNIDENILGKQLLSICLDGNSCDLGVESRFPGLLYDKFPNIIIWYCLVHRLENSVGDIIEKISGINYFQQFLEKLYNVCRTSPKNHKQLAEVDKYLSDQLSETQDIQQLSWLASKFKTVQSVWNSYSVLYNHFSEAAKDLLRSSEERAMYNELRLQLASIGFVKNLGIIYDALQELSELSTELQKHEFSAIDAHNSIMRQIKIFESMIHKPGPMNKKALAAESTERFFNVPLQKIEESGLEINRDNFFEELTKNLRRCLPSTKPTAHTSEKNNFVALISELKVVQKKFWPDDVSITYGEDELTSLCERIGVECRPTVRSFRVFKESGGRLTDDNIDNLNAILRLIPVASSECQRVLNESKTIKMSSPNIPIRHLSDILFIRLYGPPVKDFAAFKYVRSWPNLEEHLANCRNDDTIEIQDDAMRVNEEILWKLF